ncbi:hypothetical protein D3C72_1123080 [compost metagenome]
MHREHSGGAIVAHPRQDHPNGVAPRMFRHRMKQHIHRRTVPVNRRTVMNLDLIVRTATRQFHMLIARGDIRVTRQNALAVLRLFHAYLTQFIQTLGERTGKARWHMLGNKNTRARERQWLEYMANCLCSSG